MFDINSFFDTFLNFLIDLDLAKIFAIKDSNLRKNDFRN